jgi:hypothetical protein
MFSRGLVVTEMTKYGGNMSAICRVTALLSDTKLTLLSFSPTAYSY